MPMLMQRPGRAQSSFAALFAASLLAFPASAALGNDTISSDPDSAPIERQAPLRLAADDSGEETQPSGMSAADAFETAKELDTIDGWEAFLKSFPTGVRADLARAYLKKLQSGEAPETEAPASPAPATAPAAAPPPAPEPPLPTVDLGQGNSAWYTLSYPINKTTVRPAAAVQANGIQAVAYCNAYQELYLLLRPNPPGAYPEFSRRVAQGLNGGAGYEPGPQGRRITIHFSNNAEVTASAWRWPTGELAIGNPTDPHGFKPNGAVVVDLMSQSWVRFSAPPFQSTVQLNGSRIAICSTFSRCGVIAPGCAKPAPPRVVPSPPPPKPRHCPRGMIRLEGRCMPRHEGPGFCGPGYHPYHGRCVHGAYRPPRVVPRALPRRHGCPPGQDWNPQEGCHYND